MFSGIFGVAPSQALCLIFKKLWMYINSVFISCSIKTVFTEWADEGGGLEKADLCVCTFFVPFCFREIVGVLMVANSLDWYVAKTLP